MGTKTAVRQPTAVSGRATASSASNGGGSSKAACLITSSTSELEVGTCKGTVAMRDAYPGARRRQRTRITLSASYPPLGVGGVSPADAGSHTGSEMLPATDQPPPEEGMPAISSSGPVQTGGCSRIPITGTAGRNADARTVSEGPEVTRTAEQGQGKAQNPKRKRSNL